MHTLSDTIWIGINGETTCTTHAGHYLATAASADPTATEHRTPLDHWIAAHTLTSTPPPCETC